MLLTTLPARGSAPLYVDAFHGDRLSRRVATPGDCRDLRARARGPPTLRAASCRDVWIRALRNLLALVDRDLEAATSSQRVPARDEALLYRRQILAVTAGTSQGPPAADALAHAFGVVQAVEAIVADTISDRSATLPPPGMLVWARRWFGQAGRLFRAHSGRSAAEADRLDAQLRRAAAEGRGEREAELAATSEIGRRFEPDSHICIEALLDDEPTRMSDEECASLRSPLRSKRARARQDDRAELRALLPSRLPRLLTQADARPPAFVRFPVGLVFKHKRYE